MTISQSPATPLPGVVAHLDAVRASTVYRESNMTPSSAPVECGMCHEIRPASTWCMDSDVGEYAVCAGCNPRQGRRMIAVTVALSEPMDSTPLDWPATIAANLRLLYANTTVEVIDTWRVDE